MGCLNNKCTNKIKDWAGVYYIPSDCTDGPGRPPGTCGRGFSWPRKLNEECALHTDCGVNTDGTPMACFNSKCTPEVKDWAGNWYLPSDCTDGPGRPPGTCGRGFNWPRKLNQECRLHTDCEGHMPGQNTLACDNGKCTQQLRDWAGVYYIPSECRNGIFAGPGTC